MIFLTVKHKTRIYSSVRELAREVDLDYYPWPDTHDIIDILRNEGKDKQGIFIAIQ